MEKAKKLTTKEKIKLIQDMTVLWVKFCDNLEMDDLKKPEIIAVHSVWSQIHKDKLAMKQMGFALERSLEVIDNPLKILEEAATKAMEEQQKAQAELSEKSKHAAATVKAVQETKKGRNADGRIKI